MTNALRVMVVVVLAGGLAAGSAAVAADKACVPFNGKNLDGWKLKGPQQDCQWKIGIAKVDPANPGRLIAEPAEGKAGEMVNAIAKGHSVDIYTDAKFGDATISLEIMVPKGSNSGVYVMGEYEIQVLDSYGKKSVGPGDMGGIYGAKAPAVNASKKPGEWQQMTVEYIAPKFDPSGKKVSNIKFVQVTLNGQVIHHDLELPAQTPGGVTGREAATGPLMFQGNHGPVAYRNIRIVPKK